MVTNIHRPVITVVTHLCFYRTLTFFRTVPYEREREFQIIYIRTIAAWGLTSNTAKIGKYWLNLQPSSTPLSFLVSSSSSLEQWNTSLMRTRSWFLKQPLLWCFLRKSGNWVCQCNGSRGSLAPSQSESTVYWWLEKVIMTLRLWGHCG